MAEYDSDEDEGDIDDEGEDEGLEEEATGDDVEKPGFLEVTSSPGQLGHITGAMRQGKTNEAANLMEEAVKIGYDVYTNVLFFENNEIDRAIQERFLKQPRAHYIPMPPQIHTVTKASELILGLYSTRKNITFLDESMFYAGSKRGQSREVRWLEEFVTQIGKLDSSLWLISQVKSRLTMMLKEDLPSYELRVYKLASGKRNVDIYLNTPGYDEQHVDSWEDVPPSHLPFDSTAPAGFLFDLNMEHFIDKISKLTSLKIRDEIPRIVEELLHEGERGKSETGRSKSDVIRSIIESHKKGITNKEIAVLMAKEGLRVDLSLIGRIRREMKLC